MVHTFFRGFQRACSVVLGLRHCSKVLMHSSSYQSGPYTAQHWGLICLKQMVLMFAREITRTSEMKQCFPYVMCEATGAVSTPLPRKKDGLELLLFYSQYLSV